MTTREFVQHLILNCELDDEVSIEVHLPDDVKPGFFCMIPVHAYRLGEGLDCKGETLIECKGVTK